MQILKEFKPISAVLRDINFGHYLQSNEFDNRLMENNLDEIWDLSLTHINGDTIYIGNTDAHEETFFYILYHLYKENKDLLFEFLTVILIGVIEWGKPNGFSKLIEYAKKLEFTEEQIKLIEKTISKKNMVVSGHTILKNIKKDNLVFIGHGRGILFREVEEYLRGEDIPFESFESEDRSGKHIVDILKGLLDKATFAILIITADDKTNNGTIRARQNVIHEIGLFQGRLGFENVVILKQDEAEDFSNNSGLQYIKFQKDDIQGAFYSLGRKLKASGLI